MTISQLDAFGMCRQEGQTCEVWFEGCHYWAPQRGQKQHPELPSRPESCHCVSHARHHQRCYRGRLGHQWLQGQVPATFEQREGGTTKKGLGNRVQVVGFRVQVRRRGV